MCQDKADQESCSKTELLEISQCEGKISTEMFSESPGDEGEWLHRTRFSEAEKIPQTGWNPLSLPIADGMAV